MTSSFRGTHDKGSDRAGRAVPVKAALNIVFHGHHLHREFLQFQDRRPEEAGLN